MVSTDCRRFFFAFIFIYFPCCVFTIRHHTFHPVPVYMPRHTHRVIFDGLWFVESHFGRFDPKKHFESCSSSALSSSSSVLSKQFILQISGPLTELWGCGRSYSDARVRPLKSEIRLVILGNKICTLRRCFCVDEKKEWIIVQLVIYGQVCSFVVEY